MRSTATPMSALLTIRNIASGSSVDGKSPAEYLTPEERVAFCVAYKLTRGGVLPEPLYRLAVDTFGQHGANEMFYLVGLYSLVSVTLNAFNVPVPERE